MRKNMFLSTAEMRPSIKEVFDIGLKRASLPLPLSPPATAQVWYLRMYLSSWRITGMYGWGKH